MIKNAAKSIKVAVAKVVAEVVKVAAATAADQSINHHMQTNHHRIKNRHIHRPRHHRDTVQNHHIIRNHRIRIETNGIKVAQVLVDRQRHRHRRHDIDRPAMLKIRPKRAFAIKPIAMRMTLR